MKILFLSMTAILLFGVAPASGQCSPPVRCPREAVQDFVQWNFGGALLKGDGWTKASKFFLHYDDTPPAKVGLSVIYHDYSVDDVSIQGSRAKIYFGFFELGQIDSSLRWRSADPSIMKYASTFDLVLSEKRWETGSNGKTIEYAVTPPQWLIDITGPPGLWVSVESALRYVTTMREKATDPQTRKNADATIATLEKLKTQEKGIAVSR